MKNYKTLFMFDIKKQMQSSMLWITAFIFLALLLAEQAIYIQHFKLQDENDYNQIKIRRVVDISKPLYGEERIDNYTDNIKKILSLSSVSGDEIERIGQEIHISLLKYKDLQIQDVMNEIGVLKKQYESMQLLSDYIYQSEYIYSYLKEEEYPSIRNYIDNEGVSFEQAFSRQYAQMAAMIACIAFSIYFSFLFSSEMNNNIIDTLRIVKFNKKAIYIIKFIAGVVACCIVIIISTFIIFVLVKLHNPNIGIDLLGYLFSSLFIYAFPTVLFISALVTFLSVFTKSSYVGLPIGLVSIFLSSITIITSNGNSEQNMFFSPLVMSSLPYYAPLTSDFRYHLFASRLFWLVLSIILIIASGSLWDKQYYWKQKKDKETSKKEKLSNLDKKSTSKFMLLNAKISLLPVALLGAIAFAIAPVFLNHFVSITEIGPTILSNVGWAAILLFSRLISLEYAFDTFDTLFLTRMSKLRIVMTRCLLMCAILLAVELLVYAIALIYVPAFTMTAFIFCLSRSLLAFFTNIMFWGSLAMFFSTLFQQTWIGLAITTFIHLLLLSKANTYSAINMYFYKVYYTSESQSDYLLLLSSSLYILLSIIIILLSSYVIKKRFKSLHHSKKH